MLPTRGKGGGPGGKRRRRFDEWMYQTPRTRKERRKMGRYSDPKKVASVAVGSTILAIGVTTPLRIPSP